MKKSFVATMVVSSIFGSSITVCAAAQNSVEVQDAAAINVTADKVETTSSASEKKAIIDSRLELPKSTAIQTETLTHKDIERLQPKNLLDLIQNGLGMVTEVWGNNRYARVETRGGDNVGIIIDGIWYPETQSSRTLTVLPVDMIESITFVRDSSVLTLGPVASFATNMVKSGAPNQGFIIIKTLKATKPIDKITVGYSSYNTKKYDLVHADKIGNDGYYAIGYEKSRSNGASNYNASYNFDSYFFKTGAQLKNGWATDLSLLVNNGTRQIPYQFDSYNVPKTSSTSGGYWNPTDSTMISASAEKKWNEHVTTDFSFGYSALHATRTFYNSSTTSKQNEYLRELNWWNTYKYGRDTLKIGTQFMWWHAPNGVQGGSAIGYERQEELYGSYIYDERKISDKLTIDAAVRLDKKHITKGAAKYYDNSTSTAYDQTYGEIWEGDSKAVSLGANYKLSKKYDLTSRLGYTNQSAGKYAEYTVNNEGLDPEQRYKFEAGIAGHYNKKINASLTAFHYYIKNARVAVGSSAEYDSDGNPIYIYSQTNLSRQGLELALDGALTDHLNYKIGYAYFESSNPMDNSYSPHNRESISLNYKNKSIGVNLMLLRVGKFAVLNGGQSATYYSSSDPVTANCGGYTTLNASISKDLNSTTTLTFYGRNLQNRHYLSGMSYYDPGREWGIELTKKF